MDPKEMSSLSAMLSSFSTRMNDLEERHSLLTEKMTVISQTFLNNAQRFTKELSIVSEEISALRQEIDKIKEITQTLLEQSSEFVRKQEIQNVEKYMQTWEPMHYATIEDVKKMISEALKNKKASSKDKIIKVEED